MEHLPGTVTKSAARNVVRDMRGTSAGERLIVRQFGWSGDLFDPQMPPLIEPDHVYLLFLDAFHGPDGAATGDYVITGLAGQFEESAPGTYRRQDPMSTDLPGTITEADASAAVARSPYATAPR